jgi:hypothetical protein
MGQHQFDAARGRGIVLNKQNAHSSNLRSGGSSLTTLTVNG